jgi:hypothetical protein
VEAPVVPANLMVMLAQIGTPWMPDLAGCLLILEDVDEAAYQIDRGLTQLRQVGILPKLAGLVFGDFRNVEEAKRSPFALNLFKIDGVEGVFFGSDFISITKNDNHEWQMLKPSISETIIESYKSGVKYEAESIRGWNFALDAYYSQSAYKVGKFKITPKVGLLIEIGQLFVHR